MAEFGHIFRNGRNLCIDSWGVGPFVIEAGGKSFRFEDSDRFGPSLVNKDGEISAKPFPGERSPFWKAHTAWVRQGRRTEDGKICIYDPPKPTTYHRIGKTRVVIEHGDEGGGYVEVPPREPVE